MPKPSIYSTSRWPIFISLTISISPVAAPYSQQDCHVFRRWHQRAAVRVGQVVGSGSHILRIEGYSGTKGLGNGLSINSETFPAGGHHWCLRYYPDSTDIRRGSDWITITLSRVGLVVNEVHTNFTISLLDQDGNPVPSYSRTYRHTFTVGDLAAFIILDECGKALIEKSELEKSAYLKDDAFSVRCDVTVVNKIFTKAIPVSEVCRGVVKQEK